jgi:hypothetical protein
MTFGGNIVLKRMIVHILDNTVQMPIFSESEHPLDKDVNEFIENHIMKILDDDGIKTAFFTGNDNKIQYICSKIQSHQESFIQYTSEMAGILYDLIQKYPDIPSSDVIFVLLDIDGESYFAILKLNYRESFIHHVGNSQSGRVNTIIKQKAALPSGSQKIDECVLINLKDKTIQLLEKKYDINGEKEYYFSAMFLNCTTQMSDKEKVNLFKRATKSFNKKFCGDDITKTADLKKAVVESIEQNNTIDIVDVAENVFKRNPDLKNNYIEHIEKAGLKDMTIEVSEKLSEKIFKNHKIKTDIGIELNLPVDYFSDRDKIEFLNNLDGTISIIIKNITSITDI